MTDYGWKWGKQSSAQHSPDVADREERARFDAEYTQAKIDLAVHRANYRNWRSNVRSQLTSDAANRESARKRAWAKKGELYGPHGATDESELTCPDGWPDSVNPDDAVRETLVALGYDYVFSDSDGPNDE
jgi:hypothetical protein